jgi:hypothetical protein
MQLATTTAIGKVNVPVTAESGVSSKRTGRTLIDFFARGRTSADDIPRATRDLRDQDFAAE